METTKHISGRDVILWDTRDLMIGNLFRYKGELVEITSLSLDIDDEYEESIGFCKLGEHSHEISDWNRSICGDFEAVALTADVFKDFGFIGSQEMYQAGYFIQFYKRGDYAWEPNADGTGLRFNITYAHELQNFYFMTTGKYLRFPQKSK